MSWVARRLRSDLEAVLSAFPGVARHTFADGVVAEQSRPGQLMPRMRLSTVGTGRMSELIDRYRRNAEKCLQLAQAFNDLDAKRALLVMANAWLTLAAQRQKNIQAAPLNEPPSVNEPPPPLDEPLPPGE